MRKELRKEMSKEMKKKMRKEMRGNENLNDNVNEKENENVNENENEEENENENHKTLIIKQLNEIVDNSKSFEDQIESIKKAKNLNEYYNINDYGNKELEFKIFKLNLAHLSNIIDKKIFKQIFSHTFETLANKLINATNKEGNKIIVNNIKENKKKLYKEKEDDYVIQPSDRRNNLTDAIDLILDFNESIQLDLI